MGGSLDEALIDFADAAASAQDVLRTSGNRRGTPLVVRPQTFRPDARKAATPGQEGVGIMSRSRAALASGVWAAYAMESGGETF
jgi:hypothetical protein